VKKKEDKEFDVSKVISGALDIFGLKIDLGKLLSSPEEVRGRLDELREKLKRAGGKEVRTDEEWSRGEVSISGHVRTRGVLGDREYHIGTGRQPGRQRTPPRSPQPPEVVEPAVDIFDEPGEIVVVAEVPGVGLNDLKLEVQDKVLSLSTKPETRKAYKKDIELSAEVDGHTLKAACRNGILELRLQKKKSRDI
jgi:HSP20 family protein